MSETPKLRATKDYRLFSVSKHNRDINPGHLRKLKPSMEEYGWIPAFPMLVRRTAKGLEILDGQHRFSVARELGLAVWFVECDDGFNIPLINASQVPWRTLDYAESFSKCGKGDYSEVIAFAEIHQMQIGDAAALLAGTTSFPNIRKCWIAGTYRITERDYAERVAYLYTSIREMTHATVDKSLRLALIAIARVPGVDYARLVRNAARLPERFMKFATREGALQMLEAVYNYGRREHVGIKVAAENAMRDRNPAMN